MERKEKRGAYNLSDRLQCHLTQDGSDACTDLSDVKMRVNLIRNL
ncbi:MAG: hypothetical protein BAJATHORv1_20532 [Candidatus Thorarchaeota archaeon]|nr:MAG: hypothetical protein BAJATHORv1_20532 [Candidatus Thorarchaeota archaeon]